MLQEGRGSRERGSCRSSPPCPCWPPDLHRGPQRNAQNEGIAGEELSEAALAHSLTAHFLWVLDEPGLCSAARGAQGESSPTLAIPGEGCCGGGGTDI